MSGSTAQVALALSESINLTGHPVTVDLEHDHGRRPELLPWVVWIQRTSHPHPGSGWGRKDNAALQAAGQTHQHHDS